VAFDCYICDCTHSLSTSWSARWVEHKERPTLWSDQSSEIHLTSSNQHLHLRPKSRGVYNSHARPLLNIKTSHQQSCAMLAFTRFFATGLLAFVVLNLAQPWQPIHFHGGGGRDSGNSAPPPTTPDLPFPYGHGPQDQSPSTAPPPPSLPSSPVPTPPKIASYLDPDDKLDPPSPPRREPGERLSGRIILKARNY
jgi:hypothetical protein